MESIPCFTDKELTCVDCGRKFKWEVGEQRFYWSKGLATPKRCPECRKFRRDTIVRDGGM